MALLFSSLQSFQILLSICFEKHSSIILSSFKTYKNILDDIPKPDLVVSPQDQKHLHAKTSTGAIRALLRDVRDDQRLHIRSYLNTKISAKTR